MLPWRTGSCSCLCYPVLSQCCSRVLSWNVFGWQLSLCSLFSEGSLETWGLICVPRGREAGRNSSADTPVPCSAEWAGKQGPASLEMVTRKKWTFRLSFLFADFPMSVQENLLPVILGRLIQCLPSIPASQMNTRNSFRKRLKFILAGQEGERVSLG